MGSGKVNLKENQLQHYLDIAGSFFISINKDQNVTYINKRGASILEYSIEEIIGRNYFDSFYPEKGRKKGKERFMKLFELKESQTRSFDSDVVTATGKIRTINWTNALVKDADNNVTEIISSGNDITDQMKIIQQRLESEMKYRALVEATDTGYSIVDQNGILKDANERYISLLGYSNLLDLKGKQLLSWIAPHHRNRVMECMKMCIKSRKVNYSEVDIVDRNGEIVPVQFTTKAVVEHDKTELITLCRDLREQREHEMQNRLHEQQLIQADKMASIGILVSGVAHEINNPNNFVMLNVPLLKSMWQQIQPVLMKHYEQNGDFRIGKRLTYSDAKDYVPKLLNGIYEGSKRIENIVRELKDYARQQDTNEMSLILINEVVNTSFILTENLIRKKTSNLIFDLDERIPPVRANFQKIEQVIINILQNSSQALTHSGQGIFVSTFYDKNKKHVVCKIEDEGKGMDKETLKKIKDPFFTTKRTSGGTGLGLAVSSKIVMQYNGTLEFISEPGKGTTAILSFPAVV